jgi:hypothetical protein
MQIARQIEAGNCFINNIVMSDPRLPFGGVKASVFGGVVSARFERICKHEDYLFEVETKQKDARILLSNVSSQGVQGHGVRLLSIAA